MNNDNHKTTLDHLEKLADLKDRGVVTSEEFDKKKKELLGFATDTDKEEVESQVITASVIRRFFNFVIDSVLSYIVIQLLAFQFGFAIGYLTGNPDTLLIEMLVVVYGLFFLYYAIPESINGRTLAKYITRTKVVRKDGTKPSFINIFIRTLVRIIPFDPVSYLFSNRPVGWHDQASGTIVINDSKSDKKHIDGTGLKIFAILLRVVIIGTILLGVLLLLWPFFL